MFLVAGQCTTTPAQPPEVPVRFEMVATGQSPFPTNDRKNLSVNCGGGKGVLIKKVSGNMAWRGIPAVGKGDHLAVPNKKNRKGKAGSSGSPWVIHSPQVGDVLVGITHGGGRAPQVAYAARWIQQSVTRHSSDRLVWATKPQTLKK